MEEIMATYEQGEGLPLALCGEYNAPPGSNSKPSPSISLFRTGVSDGIITFQEFHEYYRDISAGIDSDDYFELMVRNAWHISGGEGAAANTSCRRVLVTHSDKSEEVVEVRSDERNDEMTTLALGTKVMRTCTVVRDAPPQ